MHVVHRLHGIGQAACPKYASDEYEYDLGNTGINKKMGNQVVR